MSHFDINGARQLDRFSVSALPRLIAASILLHPLLQYWTFESVLDDAKPFPAMAPHPGIDTEHIKNKARKDLLDLLEGVCKAHCDRTKMG